MSRSLLPCLALAAACGTGPESMPPEPAAWEPPSAHSGLPQRACDTRAQLDTILAHLELPEFDPRATPGTPPAGHDDPIVAGHLAQLRATAHCEAATAPRYETTMALFQALQYQTLVSAAAEPHHAHRAALELFDVWAIAQTRRHGSLVDLAVGQAVEWLVLDALDTLEPHLLHRDEIAAEVASLWERRPPPDFLGEAWSAGRWGGHIPGCTAASLETTTQVQAAWNSDDPGVALDAVPVAERWELLLRPGTVCTTGAARVARDMWDSEVELQARTAALIDRLE